MSVHQMLYVEANRLQKRQERLQDKLMHRVSCYRHKSLREGRKVFLKTGEILQSHNLKRDELIVFSHTQIA